MLSAAQEPEDTAGRAGAGPVSLAAAVANVAELEAAVVSAGLVKEACVGEDSMLSRRSANCEGGGGGGPRLTAPAPAAPGGGGGGGGPAQ